MSIRNTLALSALLVVMAACPKEVGGQGGASEWRKVDAGPTLLRPDVDEAMQENFKRLGAEKRVKRMQAAFTVDGEQECKVDGDCTLTPWHCCPCEHGGKLVGVSRVSVPTIVQRRAAVCPEYTCPTVMSNDPTCAATAATCVKGRCTPDVPEGAGATGGVGVEPIVDEKPSKGGAVEGAPSP